MGFSLTEALLVGNPIIANVTGGMQDQMRFEDENGDWFTPDEEFLQTIEVLIKNMAPWAFPVFPTSISIQGSPPTPYIFDDRCEAEVMLLTNYKVYNLEEELKKRGLNRKRMGYSDEAGFTSEKMA
jgi:hypothetical protein